MIRIELLLAQELRIQRPVTVADLYGCYCSRAEYMPSTSYIRTIAAVYCFIPLTPHVCHTHRDEASATAKLKD